MLSAALIFVSFLTGYVIVVGLMTLSTYGIVNLKPSLAVQKHRITAPYNLLIDLLWLLCSAVGACIVATGATEASPRNAAVLLGAALIALVWSNRSEAHQRGLIHMMLTSLSIIAGTVVGYTFRMQFTLQ